MRRCLRWRWLRLKRWLRKKPEGLFDYLYQVFNCLFINLVWVFLIGAIVTIWDFGCIQKWEIGDYLIFFPMAYLEELTFRWMPLCFLIALFGKKRISVLLIASLISSFFFGLVHGHWYNLGLQGVLGIVFCAFFIKCSTTKRPFSLQLPALLVTTTAHALYNICVVFFST